MKAASRKLTTRDRKFVLQGLGCAIQAVEAVRMLTEPTSPEELAAGARVVPPEIVEAQEDTIRMCISAIELLMTYSEHKELTAATERTRQAMAVEAVTR